MLSYVVVAGVSRSVEYPNLNRYNRNGPLQGFSPVARFKATLKRPESDFG